MTPEELSGLGLYDANAADAEEQLALLEWLVARGATVPQLLEAHARSRLIAVAGDLLVFPEGRPLTARQVADRAGVDLEAVQAVWRALGLSVPRDEEPRFAEADVAVFVDFRAATEVLDERAVLEFVRVLGSSLARVAEAAERDLRR